MKNGYRGSPVEYEAFKRNPEWSFNNINKSGKRKRNSNNQEKK